MNPNIKIKQEEYFTKKETRDIFVTSDNREFNKIEEAENYQGYLERINSIETVETSIDGTSYKAFIATKETLEDLRIYYKISDIHLGVNCVKYDDYLNYRWYPIDPKYVKVDLKENIEEKMKFLAILEKAV